MTHAPRSPFTSWADEGVTSTLFGGAGNRYAPGNFRQARHGSPILQAKPVRDWFFGPRTAASGWRLVRAGVTGGTQNITLPGFADTPKAALIIVTGTTSLTGTAGASRRISVGFMDGSSSGGSGCSSQDSQSGSVAKNTSFTEVVRLLKPDGSGYNAFASGSLIAGGVSLVWTTGLPATAYVVDVVLFYGPQLQVQYGTATPASQNAGPGLINVGFRPQMIFTTSGVGAAAAVSNDWDLDIGWSIDGLTSRMMSTRENTGIATTQVASWGFTDGTVRQNWKESTPLDIQNYTTYISTFHDQGFLLGTSGGSDPSLPGDPINYLALNFGDKEFTLTDQVTPTSATLVSYFGCEEQPGYAMTFNRRTNWAGKDKTFRSAAFGYGFFNAPEQQCTTGWARDNVATTSTGNRDKASAFFSCTDTGADELEATFNSMDSYGYTLNWSAVAAASFGFVAATVERDLLEGVDGAPSFRQMTAAGVGEEDFVATDGTPNLPHPMTCSAVAEEDFVATGAANLPHPMTGTGTGEEDFIGTSAGSFDQLQGAAVALEEFIATDGLPNLPHPMTAVGVGETDIVGTGAANLPSPMTATGTGEEDFLASGDASFDQLQGAAVALEEFIAAADGALPSPMTCAADGVTGWFATGDCVLPQLQGAAVGEEDFVGTCAGTLSQLTCEGHGVNGQEVDGTGSCFLPSPMTATGTCLEVFDSNGLGEFPRDMTCSGTGEVSVDGTGAAMLPAPMVGGGTAEEDFVATSAGTLPHPLTCAAAGVTGWFASGDANLPHPLTGTGSGEEWFLATSAGAFDQLQSACQALEEFIGSAAGTFGQVQGACQAQEVFEGDCAGTLPHPPTGAGSGLEALVGSGDTLLPHLVASGTGELWFLGSAAGAFPGCQGASQGLEVFLATCAALLPHPMVGTGTDVQLACPDSLAAGWSETGLAAAGDNQLDLLPAGATVLDVLAAGTEATAALAAGWGALSRLAAGFAAQDLDAGGAADLDLLAAGFSALDALGGGWDALDDLGASHLLASDLAGGYGSVDALRASCCTV